MADMKDLAKKMKWAVMIAILALTAAPGFAQSKQTASNADPNARAKTAEPTNRAVSIDNKSYVIGENDLLSIDVWKQQEISRQVPVRPDGKISLPLIGQIQASGLTPLQLQDNITEKLKTYISNPEVTVIVEDPRSHQFNIVGQVQHPGQFPLSESMTVLDAIAAAGGFRDFAKETKIYVLRPMPGGIRVRIKFNYKNVIKGKDLHENVALEPGDTIVVP
jgi:polysaccharide export outer membrane protein